MDFKNYTVKAQEVVQKASEIALGNGQQAIETGHLLQAILSEDENVIAFIAKKLGVNLKNMSGALDAIVSTYPKVSGGNGSVYLSNDTAAAFAKASNYTKEFGDEFVSVELMLLGLMAGKEQIATLLKDAGFNEKQTKAAINELRKGNSVKDQNAEAKYQSLERYSINLNERARTGKIDPVIGRDEEIRRVLQILSRRTKNNPI